MTAVPGKTIYVRSPVWTTLGRLAAGAFFVSIGVFFCAISGALVPSILAGLGLVEAPTGATTMSPWRLYVGVASCGGLGLLLVSIPARWMLDVVSSPTTIEGALERKEYSSYQSPNNLRRVTRRLVIGGQSFEVNAKTFDSVHEGMPLRAEIDRWSRALRRLDHLA